MAGGPHPWPLPLRGRGGNCLARTGAVTRQETRWSTSYPVDLLQGNPADPQEESSVRAELHVNVVGAH